MHHGGTTQPAFFVPVILRLNRFGELAEKGWIYKKSVINWEIQKSGSKETVVELKVLTEKT